MPNIKYPNLFSPLTIRGKTFKNRILVAPMGTEDPADGGYMSERCAYFYEDIAKGGSARVCTVEASIAPGVANRNCYYFFEENPSREFRTNMGLYSKLCHRHGALAFTSFTHIGVYTHPVNDAATADPNGPPVDPVPLKADGTPYFIDPKSYGPSELDLVEPWDGVTREGFNAALGDTNGKHIYEMSLEKMNEIADAYAHCAKVAKSVGMDGCIIHGGHGFLFGQFISPRLNKRTDEFGGSMENRCRFPIMCLKRIREAVGEDFIIEIRFSGEENISPISDREFYPDLLTIDDCVGFFKELDKEPGLCDIAHISAGVHVLPALNTRVTANALYPMGYNVKLAEAVKKAVKNMAVGVVGSLSDPALCEEVIASGKADFVIMARQLLIADPEFPKKALAGEDSDINNCLRCVNCRGTGYCAVNPVDMFEPVDRYGITKAAVSRRVAVVGGGIAGLKAAEVAAKRGHSVVLFEKAPALGGILRYTDNDPHKTDIRRYKDHMIERITALGVDIRLGTEATPELVAQENPFAVIAATGGRPAVMDGTVDAFDAYMAPDSVGERVAVIGGGLTGCEAAIHFAELGRRVTLISRSPVLMKELRESANTHLIFLDKNGVDCLKGAACKAVTDKGVLVTTADGEERLVEADTVINATGMRADRERAEAFCGIAPYFAAVGDCTKAALIGNAVEAAYYAAMDI